MALIKNWPVNEKKPVTKLVELMKTLIDGRARLDADDGTDEGRTALVYACEKGEGFELAARCLFDQKGADDIIKGTGKRNKVTPLIAASTSGLNVVQELLDKRADSTHKFWNKTALGWAATQGHEKIARTLFDFNFKPHQQEPSEEKTKLSDTCEDINQLLVSAAKQGWQWMLEELLKMKGIFVDHCTSEEPETALAWACIKGEEGIIMKLLDAGAQVSCDGRSALLHACEQEKEEIALLLVDRMALSDRGADSNALILAAKKGWYRVVKQLVTFDNIKVDHQEQTSGETALMKAARSQDPLKKDEYKMIVRQLLESRAWLGKKKNTSDAQTAMDIAEQAGRSDIVTILTDWAVEFGETTVEPWKNWAENVHVPDKWRNMPKYWDQMRRKPKDEKLANPIYQASVMEQQVRTSDRDGKEFPKSFRLEKLFRIQHEVLWNKYVAVRWQVMTNIGKTPLGKVANMSSGGAVKTEEVMKDWNFIKGDERALGSKVNEVFLFHGCGTDAALSIAMNGFEIERVGTGKGSMFGPGFYFAESSTKSDEYTAADKSGACKGWRAMLLCRVVLGQFHHQGLANDLAKDGIKEQLKAHDSVVGDRQAFVGTYREFIVFHQHQVYPEFLIYYSWDEDDHEDHDDDYGEDEAAVASRAAVASQVKCKHCEQPQELEKYDERQGGKRKCSSCGQAGGTEWKCKQCRTFFLHYDCLKDIKKAEEKLSRAKEKAIEEVALCPQKHRMEEVPVTNLLKNAHQRCDICKRTVAQWPKVMCCRRCNFFKCYSYSCCRKVCCKKCCCAMEPSKSGSHCSLCRAPAECSCSCDYHLCEKHGKQDSAGVAVNSARGKQEIRGHGGQQEVGDQAQP